MIVDILNEAPAPFTGTEVHTLPNGFKIILKQDNTVPVVAIQAWARCGAVNESPNIYGISHGLEHMVFKGTPTRNAGEITRAIEGHGGYINAATQLETTHYYIEVPSDGADTAMDVLIDAVRNPTFPQEELERERLVILEEIHRREDSPEATLWDEFCSALFKGTPYEIKVIGNEKTVSSMKQEDLTSYFRAHYVPGKQCFVVVGDIDKAKVLQKLKQVFENDPAKDAPPMPPVNTDKWTPSQATVKKPVQLSYLAAGFPTIGLGEKDVVALDLLADVLCGGVSSRFYQRLREEKQAFLSISCDYIPFSQKGLFSFFMDALPEKAKKGMNQLFEEIQNIEKNPFREEELARAKMRTKSDWLMGSETARGQASTLGSFFVLGHGDLISKYLSRVEAMTVDQLMDVYRRYSKNQKFSQIQLDPAS